MCIYSAHVFSDRCATVAKPQRQDPPLRRQQAWSRQSSATSTGHQPSGSCWSSCVVRCSSTASTSHANLAAFAMFGSYAAFQFIATLYVQDGGGRGSHPHIPLPVPSSGGNRRPATVFQPMCGGIGALTSGPAPVGSPDTNGASGALSRHRGVGAESALRSNANCRLGPNPSRNFGRRLIRIVTSSIQARIAGELGVRDWQVKAAVDLLDGGATVPFISRYRKEGTGGLDDAQLRLLEERVGYLRQLEERRTTILESVMAQGKLDDALRARIVAADSKVRLEDVYLPYKPKRRTKAQTAREAGLEPLADRLLSDPRVEPRVAAAAFVDPERGVADPADALEGARSILVERFARTPTLLAGCAKRCGPGAAWSRGCGTASKGQGPTSPTTSTSPSLLPGCPRIGFWLCSGARKKTFSTCPGSPASWLRP